MDRNNTKPENIQHKTREHQYIIVKNIIGEVFVLSKLNIILFEFIFLYLFAFASKLWFEVKKNI